MIAPSAPSPVVKTALIGFAAGLALFALGMIFAVLAPTDWSTSKVFGVFSAVLVVFAAIIAPISSASNASP